MQPLNNSLCSHWKLSRGSLLCELGSAVFAGLWVSVLGKVIFCLRFIHGEKRASYNGDISPGTVGHMGICTVNKSFVHWIGGNI